MTFGTIFIVKYGIIKIISKHEIKKILNTTPE